MEGFDAATGQAPQPQQGGGDMLSGANLSEEQRAQIDKFVLKGTELLVNEKFMAQAAKLIEQYPSVEEGMAQVATAIASRLYFQSIKEKAPIPMEVVIIGGALLMGQVAEFAQAAGKEIGPETVEDAFYRAADLFREILRNKGVLSDEELSQGYEQMRKEHGDETFEMISAKVENVRQANMPQAPQAAPGVGQ